MKRQEDLWAVSYHCRATGWMCECILWGAWETDTLGFAASCCQGCCRTTFISHSFIYSLISHDVPVVTHRVSQKIYSQSCTYRTSICTSWPIRAQKCILTFIQPVSETIKDHALSSCSDQPDGFVLYGGLVVDVVLEDEDLERNSEQI